MSSESARMFTAQAAIRAGKKQQARDLLREELEHNPQNFRAWLWLSGLAGSAQDSLDYVRKAEELNPEDPGVKKARLWAEQRLAREARAPQPPGSSTAQKGAEQAPPQSTRHPENAASQRVDGLRDQQRSAATEPQRGQRRRFVLGGLALLLLAAFLSALLWGGSALNLAFGALPADSATAPDAEALSPTATPRATSTSPDSVPAALSFVSGQFAPQGSPFDVAPTLAIDESEPEATATPRALEPKPVNKSSGNPRATWTLTPSPTHTPTATPTPVPTFVSEDRVVGGATRPAGVGPNERWIDVNLTTQRLVAYEGDEPVFDSLISSGTWLHPTVTGQFRVWLRYTAQTMDGRRLGYDYYLPNVPYVMYFYRDYALHGTYWHNNFGTPMSHGCVNLPTPAAEWIFNWSSIGTLVNVHH